MKWLPALVLAALGCGGSEPANADPTKSAATVETPAPPRLPDAEDILEMFPPRGAMNSRELYLTRGPWLLTGIHPLADVLSL